MTNEPDQSPSDQPPEQPPPEAPGEREPARRSRPRRLVRSRRDQMLGGVAAGFAEYVDVDPTLIRIAVVVLTLISGGAMILVYLGAWIIMPEAEPGEEAGLIERAEDGGSVSAGIIWGLILIVAGVLLLLWRLDVALPRWDVLLSGALIVVGLFLILEARRGLNGGLLAIAILLTLVLGASAFVNVRVDSGFGERTVQPASAGELERDYGHAFGTLTLDLRDLEIPEGTTRVRTSIAFGELTVRLPADAEASIRTSTTFGSSEAFGQQSAGIGAQRDFMTPDYDIADRRLDLEVSTVFGSTQVLR